MQTERQKDKQRDDFVVEIEMKRNTMETNVCSFHFLFVVDGAHMFMCAICWHACVRAREHS